MRTNLNKDQAEELFASKAFQDRVKEAKDQKEMLDIFAENGIELTAEDLQEISHNAPDGKLCDADLEQVAGGVTWGEVWKTITWFIIKYV